MTTKEAIYLLRNTAWLAPSLEPIDEAVDMACEALRKDEPQTCDTCKHKGKYAYCRLCGRLSENNYEPIEDEQSGKE